MRFAILNFEQVYWKRFKYNREATPYGTRTKNLLLATEYVD